MPIRKSEMHKYPGGGTHSKEWKALRASILERAKGRCETCGVKNHSMVWRVRKGKGMLADTSVEVKVVLTVAHLNHDPTYNEPHNLKALCQLCHNRHDAAHRRETRKKK